MRHRVDSRSCLVGGVLAATLCASFGCAKKTQPPSPTIDANALSSTESALDAAPPLAATGATDPPGDAGVLDGASILALLGGLDSDSGLVGIQGSYPELHDGRPSGSSPPPPPQLVRESSLSVAGSLDPEAVRRIVRRAMPRFNFCQRESVKRNPKAYGRVDFKVTVGAKGHVSQVTVVQKTIDDATTMGCLSSAFNPMVFPTASGETVFAYGLLLLPPDTK